MTEHLVQETAHPSGTPAFEAVAVAASAGGFHALRSILADLPSSLPAAVLVVQHLDPHHPSRLADLLGRHSSLKIAQATSGTCIEPGHVYIAPPDWHLLVDTDRTIALTHTELVHFVRPSADLLFESAAAVYRERCLAVVLSGSGSDGSLGVRAVKKVRGVIVAQDELTAEHFGMPGAAIATGSVDYVLPLPEIARAIVELVLTGELSS